MNTRNTVFPKINRKKYTCIFSAYDSITIPMQYLLRQNPGIMYGGNYEIAPLPKEVLMTDKRALGEGQSIFFRVWPFVG